MKRTLLPVLTGLSAMLCLTNCTKQQDAPYSNESGATISSRSTISALAAAPDRIDEIVKDLALQNYSLSFTSSIPSAGISRAAYGSDSYLAFVKPDAVKLPYELQRAQQLVPIWKRPNFIWPTCPDMVIDPRILSKIRELLVNADPKQFSGLKEIPFVNGGGFLASDKVISQYANLKPDAIDGITKDLNAAKFLILNDVSVYSREFGRGFYGYANINDIVFKPYKKSWKDIFKPTIKGCFDPIVLSTILDRLQKINPAAYKGFSVKAIAENRGIATLSAN